MLPKWQSYATLRFAEPDVNHIEPWFWRRPPLATSNRQRFRCERLTCTAAQATSGKVGVAPTRTIAKAPSLRDKHKSQTARALRDASLKLFATQGYDTTTIEEIAEKAGVSARTFFPKSRCCTSASTTGSSR